MIFNKYNLSHGIAGACFYATLYLYGFRQLVGSSVMFISNSMKIHHYRQIKKSVSFHHENASLSLWAFFSSILAKRNFSF